MAPTPIEHLVRDLSRVASAAEVRRAARRCGAVQRRGIVDIHALLMTVVLGVSVRGRVSLAELRRVYGEVSGTALARSSFYGRFNEGLAALLKWLLDALMANSQESPPRPPGALAFFKDVLCEDATILQLPDEMADAWPGPRTNSAPAAAKVHARVRATTGELVKVKVTHGRVADCNAFGVGHELRNTLLLFDQGYSSQSLWRRVDSVGGYFITRLPADRDPVIVGHLRRHRGRARKVKGMRLREALVGLQRTVLDVKCAFRCKVRRYRSRHGRHVTEHFRVVASHNAETGEWHVYVTNVPIDVLTGELVARTYRLRWEVEQFFKLAKSGSGLNDMPSANENIVKAFIYAALCRATVSMRGRRAVQAILGGERASHLHALTWHRVWLLHTHTALRSMLPTPRRLGTDDLRRLCAEANPNRWCTLASFAEAA